MKIRPIQTQTENILFGLRGLRDFLGEWVDFFLFEILYFSFFPGPCQCDAFLFSRSLSCLPSLGPETHHGHNLHTHTSLACISTLLMAMEILRNAEKQRAKNEVVVVQQEGDQKMVVVVKKDNERVGKGGNQQTNFTDPRLDSLKYLRRNFYQKAISQFFFLSDARLNCISS